MEVFMEMYSAEFLRKREQALQYRRASKQRILQQGGQQALLHSKKDIDRIDFALKRLQSGQYGLCLHCGCEIPEERLEIIPESPLCIQCANEQESN